MIIGMMLIQTSCHLTEYREIEVTSTPTGANAVINGDYLGATPVTVEVPNRKTLSIFLDKDGYYPVEKEIKTEKSFWGTVLWSGVDDKAYSLPEDKFHYDMTPLEPGAIKPLRKMPLKKQENASNGIRSQFLSLPLSSSSP